MVKCDADTIKGIDTMEKVDAIVTGQLYAGREMLKPIYASRTSHYEQGLKEFASDNHEPVGNQFDDQYTDIAYMPNYVCPDGLPETWNLPSTPVNWYKSDALSYNDRERRMIAAGVPISPIAHKADVCPDSYVKGAPEVNPRRALIPFTPDHEERTS